MVAPARSTSQTRRSDDTGAVEYRLARSLYGQVETLDADYTPTPRPAGNLLAQQGLFLTAADLYDNPHRIRDPKLGRFLQEDPAGYVDGMSMFSSHSILLQNYDPMGLEVSDEVIVEGTAGVAAGTAAGAAGTDVPGSTPTDIGPKPGGSVTTVNPAPGGGVGSHPSMGSDKLEWVRNPGLATKPQAIETARRPVVAGGIACGIEALATVPYDIYLDKGARIAGFTARRATLCTYLQAMDTQGKFKDREHNLRLNLSGITYHVHINSVRYKGQKNCFFDVHYLEERGLFFKAKEWVQLYKSSGQNAAQRCSAVLRGPTCCK